MSRHQNQADVLVSLDQLVVGYDGIPASAPVTAAFENAESIAIIGSNGAGKSTLLRTILGHQRPLSGKVRIFGGAPDSRSLNFRRDISVVLDEDSFFPALTVREHLEMTALGHGCEAASRAVSEELDFFSLASHANSFPHALSSGQRRRLLLSAALIRPSKLLVLDEPEQRLDQSMRARLAKRLRSRVEEGTAVIMVSHDPSVITRVADRAIHLGKSSTEMSPAEAARVISG